MRRRVRWPVAVLALALTGVLSVAAVELALRVAGVAYPVFWQVDGELGIALRPGVTGHYRDEGDGRVEINAHGMRDVPRDMSKPPGTYRIAVLGDSYVEALQVDRERAFPARLEAELNERRASGKRVEVLNFGCSGWGTAQELIAFRTRARAFAPDLVLLTFLTGNDLADNAIAFDAERRRPYFVRRDGKLALDSSFRDAAYYRSRQSPWLTWLCDHSRIAQLALVLRRRRLADAVRRAAGPVAPPSSPAEAPSAAPPSAAPAPGTPAPAASPQPSPSPSTSQSPSPEPQAPSPRPQASSPELLAARARDAGLVDAVYYPPATEAWREAWAVTEELLAALAAESRAAGAELRVVFVTNPSEVFPERATRDAYLRSLGLADLEYPTRRLTEHLSKMNVPALALAGPFRAHAERTGEFLHGFAHQNSLGGGHWNAAGHALAARLVADWITGAAR